MTATLAILRREFLSYFFSPLAYIVAAAFLLLTGFFWYLETSWLANPQIAPQLNPVSHTLFSGVLYIFTLLIPAITMRLISEELRSGSIELLMTAPVREGSVVLGKFLAALGFFASLLVPTLAYVMFARQYATPAPPDMGPIWAGYVGFLLVGGMLLSIGVFVSAFCKNQIVAYIFTAALVLLFQLIPTFTRVTTESDTWLYKAIAAVADHINMNAHFQDIGRGILDLRHILFYLSFTALFLFGATLTLSVRKSR
ncbi:MAG: ABC transporter permease subunit [Planctomycetales bacterium]|nr:ABC transporter permease subunit [Planctomycetales bacterium]